VKVLLVHPGPSFSVSDVHDGLAKGLRANGAEVGLLNLNDRLNFYSAAHVDRGDSVYVKALSRDDAIRAASKGIETVCYEWWPDVVIIVSGFFIPPEIWGCLARRPHHVVLWCTESPYEDDRQMVPAEYADTVIINDPRNLEPFREVNPRTWYLPHSYDPDRHRPGTPDPELVCDFSFVGTGFPSRIEFLETVDWTGIDARLGGNWQQLDDGSPLVPMLVHGRTECMDNSDAARLYQSSKVTANLYRRETSEGGRPDGYAIGPREVELAASGAFFLRESRVEGDMLFPMLPTFTTPAEFQDLLRWWLDHPAERNSAAVAARAAVTDRTFTNTAARLLRLVEDAPTTVR
jgi:spore maturation protein CgeB